MGVFKKKDNWWIDYYVNGKRRREKIGTSKALAETVIKKRKVQIAEGKFLDIKKESKLRFNEFADEYIELYAKINNISWKRSIVPNMKSLERYFADRYMRDITPHIIEQYKAQRVKEVSPAATNRALALLKSMFNRAIEWDKFHDPNPALKVKHFREDNHKLRYLEKEEIKRLLNVCDDFLRPILIVALNTGMRKAELFNLKWHEIDFNKGIIHLLRTKSGERREIPMNEAVKTALINTRKHALSAYIFCTKRGNPYTDIRKPFARSLKRAGIKNFRLHDTRHTFASQLVMASIDLNTVRELMGHKSIRMTLRYAHLSPNHKSHAVDQLGRHLDTYMDTGVKADAVQVFQLSQPIEKLNSYERLVEIAG